MADSLLTYGIVMGAFIFLGALLFATRAKYTKIRRALKEKEKENENENKKEEY